MNKAPFLALALSVLPLAATAQNFTTAAEVRPILGMTAASWVAVREWDGNDLVYFTHLLSWRCGLKRIYYGINGAEPTEVFETEPCYEDEPAPNAIKAELPYITLPLNSVETITVELLYDDGERERHVFERAAVRIN